MFCRQCGAQLPDDALWCHRCGTSTTATPKQLSKSKKAGKSPKQTIVFACIAGLIVVATVVAVILLVVLPNRDNTTGGSEEMKAFYQEHGELLSITDVKTSLDIQSEADTRQNFSARGFDADTVVCDYDMDGNLLMEVETGNSDTAFPVYEGEYITKNGDYWILYEINGAMTAMPISYNLENEGKKNMILSEKKSLTCYDSESNQFYEAIPNADELKVVVVDRIDSETLENYQLGVD